MLQVETSVNENWRQGEYYRVVAHQMDYGKRRTGRSMEKCEMNEHSGRTKLRSGQGTGNTGLSTGPVILPSDLLLCCVEL
jgi:hypothetical protein